MAQVAGKNKVERSFRFWFDDAVPTARDLSGDLVPGSFSGGGLVFDDANMTGVSETVRNYLSGHAEGDVSARFHMNDTATTGATTVLMAMQGLVGTLTGQWGSEGAVPATGAPEWEGEYVLLKTSIVLAGNKFVHDCLFRPSGSTAPAMGTMT